MEAIPLKTLEAKETASKLISILFCNHGCPNKILTDRGTQFTSDLFKNLTKKLNIITAIKLTTSAYNTQKNGKIEKLNRFL